MNEELVRTGNEIEPGMEVEATDADLGEEDVSKPRVAEVLRNAAGDIESVTVKKGALFTKHIEIPVERIQSIEHQDGDGSSPGKVTIAATDEELEALAPSGQEPLLPTAGQEMPAADGLIAQAEEAIPTDTGMRRLEQQSDQPAAGEEARPGLLRALGPGFISGMAGNDSSAVTSYSVDGASAGYGHLWLMLLSTPLLLAVQYACAKIGRITQKGLSDILREHYGRRVSGPAAAILVVANLALIAADLVAVGSGLELIVGLRWVWFVVPVAALLWYITVYQNFDAIKKIFLVLSLAFVSYLITAVLSKPDWGTVVSSTFIPQLDFSFVSISAAVALLGATISPYSMFWQVQGEKEEKRAGTRPQQIRTALADIGAGVISGNVVAYAIIVSTAATLFTKHQQVNSALDAAKALEPLLGPYAKYLFAVGLIGAGLIAIPVLLASTSYAVAGSIGWPVGLSKKPWQNEGFYLILTAALAASLVVALLGLDPIHLMFWANVLQGVLAPALIVLVLVVGNNSTIMRHHRIGRRTSAALALAALVMAAAVVMLLYGLLTGQSR
ncbi:MAG: NRAMP family divalent metal transporter [Chloroflexia bacterium]